MTAEHELKRQKKRRRILLSLKLALSVLVMVAIFWKILEKENAEDLWARITDLSPGFLGLAALAQLAAITSSVVRWDRLLVGQGIRAPYRHLFGSFMIGRFFGAFAPGGWTGLNGYRLYDIAVRTGKTARSTATIGIEMILGQLAMGAVVIAGSIFGLRYIGMTGVILVDLAFLGIIAVAILLLSRPALFRVVAARLPSAFRTRVQTLVDAVCAYQGRAGLVTQAALLGMGTHAFNNLIYVSAARALGVELGVGEVFFVSSLQILATLVPISVGGVGLREAAAVSLYTVVGVPAGLAVLIPIVGIAVEYAISSVGGVIFVMRKHGRDPSILVEDPDREERKHAEIRLAPPEEWPRIRRGLTLGLGAGLLSGALIGVSEGVVVALSAYGAPDFGVLAYGAVAYGLLCGTGGAAAGAFLALTGRLMKREAVPEPRAYARLTALMVSVVWLALGAFRVRRDLFEEQLVWKSLPGLGVLLACVTAAVALYFLLATGLRIITERRPGRLMLRAWGSPVVVSVLVALIAVTSALVGQPARAEPSAERPPAPPSAGNILFIVVDTLRADHLPGYGYEKGETPHLDAFAREAVRFEHAFANASWTRPSFASILTSRYPASHRVMAKKDALPESLATLPEALRGSGYETAGFVTNYNIAPFYNFQQGFDHYHYLEPNYVLGADDEAAKLLLVQGMKRVVEKVRGAQPGGAYQDAATVNRDVLAWLDTKPESPFFLFAAYMDPHDPYFEHPYGKPGYARSARQHPDPEEAGALRELYDGEITYWDTHFGALVAELKKRGLYDDLTLVVTSDHGEEFMDHGGYWHGNTLYDEQVHVPLYLKLAHNAQGGRTVRHWVESIDIMPTLLRLQGLEGPAGMAGASLFSGKDEVYAEEEHEGNVLESLRARRGAGELKLITANAQNPRGLAERELYYVDRDPREQVNVAGEAEDLVTLVEKALESHGKEAEKGAAERSEAEGMNPENLRALGYTE